MALRALTVLGAIAPPATARQVRREPGLVAQAVLNVGPAGRFWLGETALPTGPNNEAHACLGVWLRSDG